MNRNSRMESSNLHVMNTKLWVKNHLNCSTNMLFQWIMKIGFLQDILFESRIQKGGKTVVPFHL
jgi:hypothetical protein